MVETIEYIENIIATYGRATEANLQTPGREGSVVRITPELARDVMVTGDLHGHRDNFNSIQRIADLENQPGRHLVLQEVCHGGPKYDSNGGCMSHLMLEDVARLITQFPGRVHFVLGNHELSELTDYPIQKNKQMLNLLFRLGLQHVYGPATEMVRQTLFAFLQSCPLAVRTPGGVFISHSLPEHCDTGEFDESIFTRRLDPPDYAPEASVFELVWGRDYRQENAKAFAKLVDAKTLIHGHEPCPDGSNMPNELEIILDCCSDKACYVILPTDQELTAAQIAGQIEKLV